MKTLLAILVVGAVLIGVVVLIEYPWGPDEPDVPIDEEFDSKIVYTTNTSTTSAPFIEHCESMHGSFNPCGSPCPADAEACIQVCAFTCEFNGDINLNLDTSSDWQMFDNP